MAEEEEEFYEEEEDSSEALSSDERQKRSLWAYVDVQRVLLISLQYIVIAIVTFVIAYWVSSRSSQRRIESTRLTEQSLFNTAQETDDYYTPIPAGFDWTMDEMIINTSDQDAGHYVKATIVVSYDKENTSILPELTARSSQIHAEVRKVIGSKTYSDLQGIPNQEILTKEIKTKVQLIIGKPGIIDVFLKDFTLH